MGGGKGVPAIQAQGTPANTGASRITKSDVEQYVRTHKMRGERITIDYVGSEPSIVGIESVPLAEVYRRYMPDALLQHWGSPHPPETQVYLVELQGTFRFSGGPGPKKLG